MQIHIPLKCAFLFAAHDIFFQQILFYEKFFFRSTKHTSINYLLPAAQSNGMTQIQGDSNVRKRSRMF